MTPKIQAIRDEWIQKFADQIPGSFDFNEATKCWDAGFAKHAEMAKSLVEALEKIVEMTRPGVFDNDPFNTGILSAEHKTAMQALADYKKEMG